MNGGIRQQPLLLNSKIRPAYSVSFRTSGYEPTGVREDLARGMVADMASGDQRVRNDFDRVPIFRRPVCNATWSKEKRRWVDVVWRGEQGFSFSPTEPYREVLYRCQPFWYCVDMSGDAPSWVSVSQYPLEGYSLAPMFKNGTDFVYRPCFEMGLGEDGLPHSRAGLIPLEGDAVTLMHHARSYDARACTERTAEWFSDLLLMWVEFGTKRLQTQMRGFVRVGESQRAELISEPAPGCVQLRLPGNLANRFCEGMLVSLVGESSAKTFCAKARIKRIESNADAELAVLFEGELDFSGLYVDADGGHEGILVTLVSLESGLVLPFLENASSGVKAFLADGYAPMAWRGKENAWGDLSSLICDLRLATRLVSGAYIHKLYVLDDLGHWGENIDGHWRLTDLESSVVPWNYIRGFKADTQQPWIIFPNTVQSYSARYHCAIFASGVAQNFSVFVGGGHKDYKNAVSACSISTGVTKLNVSGKEGARLILHEGGF